MAEGSVARSCHLRRERCLCNCEPGKYKACVERGRRELDMDDDRSNVHQVFLAHLTFGTLRPELVTPADRRKYTFFLFKYSLMNMQSGNNHIPSQ